MTSFYTISATATTVPRPTNTLSNSVYGTWLSITTLNTRLHLHLSCVKQWQRHLRTMQRCETTSAWHAWRWSTPISYSLITSIIYHFDDYVSGVKPISVLALAHMHTLNHVIYLPLVILQVPVAVLPGTPKVGHSPLLHWNWETMLHEAAFLLFRQQFWYHCCGTSALWKGITL